jgi:hypothetical protein
MSADIIGWWHLEGEEEEEED